MGFVDVHSHVVPSGDDGAGTVREALELACSAAEHGTRILFATPHVWPELPLTLAREGEIRRALGRVRREAGLPLELRLGFELTPSRALLDEDPRRYELEGTGAVLMEVPFTGPADLLVRLARARRGGRAAAGDRAPGADAGDPGATRRSPPSSRSGAGCSR